MLHSSQNLENALDLDCRIQRQLRDADGETGMFAVFSKDRGEKIGRAIDHLGNGRKIRRAIHITAEPDSAQPRKIARHRGGLSEDIERRLTGGGLPGLQRDLAPELAPVARINARAAHRKLPRDKKEVFRAHDGRIIRYGRSGRRQGQAKRGEARFRRIWQACSHFHTSIVDKAFAALRNGPYFCKEPRAMPRRDPALKRRNNPIRRPRRADRGRREYWMNKGLLFCLIGIVFQIIPGRVAQAEAPITLAAHRAVYNLALLSGAGANAPAAARGRVAFDFSGSPCEGYIQNFRHVTEMQSAEGNSQLSDMTSATFETGDARSFRFKIETKIDRAIVETVDGKAQKKDGAAISVDLAKPRKASLSFETPVLFPTEHLRRIIEAARAGDTMLEARVYDGANKGDKVSDTMTLIGKPVVAAAPEQVAHVDTLKDMRRWPVSVSYFDPQKKDGQPIYVLSFDLYENGVSRALRLDYGDFVLKGDLVELTFSSVATCDLLPGK